MARTLPTGDTTVTVSPIARLSFFASARPMMMPLGLTSTASRLPATMSSSMVLTPFMRAGTIPESVTASSRPAKLKMAWPTSTGAAWSCPIASMAASFWPYWRMPRRSARGFTPRIATAPPGKRNAAGWGCGSRYSSRTVMWGELSTSRSMRSRSDPRISAETARKNATPSTTPSSDTIVCRRRLRRCESAMSSSRFTARAGSRPSLLRAGWREARR